MPTIRILTVVGARPQFVKAAMISHAIARRGKLGALPRVEETIINTGQHFDHNMCCIFFDELGIPRPVVNLGLGGMTHGEMTGRMLILLEREMLRRQPDWVLVYGDTNSTLAGALAAAKLHIPIAHVESGLRSHNRGMAEEINRVMTDHLSQLLFCPTRQSVLNLKEEGIVDGVIHVGDVMYDAAMFFAPIAEYRSKIIADRKLAPGNYVLATIHRAENTDDPKRLTDILKGLNGLAERYRVVFPIHPRTRNLVDAFSLKKHTDRLEIIEPVSFLDMICLERSAKVILTDSGGVQKEAYFHGVPCVTLRNETEWMETVDAGWNQLVQADEQAIAKAVDCAKAGKSIPDFGSGFAADIIVDHLIDTSGRGAH